MNDAEAGDGEIHRRPTTSNVRRWAEKSSFMRRNFHKFAFCTIHTASLFIFRSLLVFVCVWSTVITMWYVTITFHLSHLISASIFLLSLRSTGVAFSHSFQTKHLLCIVSARLSDNDNSNIQHDTCESFWSQKKNSPSMSTRCSPKMNIDDECQRQKNEWIFTCFDCFALYCQHSWQNAKRLYVISFSNLHTWVLYTNTHTSTTHVIIYPNNRKHLDTHAFMHSILRYAQHTPHTHTIYLWIFQDAGCTSTETMFVLDSLTYPMFYPSQTCSHSI